MKETTIQIDVESSQVSGILTQPEESKALYIMAHGAGAGMRHEFMERFSRLFFDRGVAVLRYQFPYMEAGSRRPDRAPLCMATVQAVLSAADRLELGLPIFAGGKSMGGRMTSMAAAEFGLPDVRGLIFLGFPLHPAGKDGIQRSEHLHNVSHPMFFLQGTRDKLADMTLMTGVIDSLSTAQMFVVEGADHGFQVLKRSGLVQADVESKMADAVVTFLQEQI
jgi:hypothetical protein